MKPRLLTALFVAAALCASATSVAAREKLPETTKDGLKLQQQTKLGAVYLKPGASLDAYDKIYLVDTYVAFKKNWARDYNEDEVNLENRVTPQWMKKVEGEIAQEFKRVFTEQLKKGGYQVTTDRGKDVMIVRPAIINLEITAPDLDTPDMETSFVRSTGDMTLYAELYDSVTNDKFAEVLDAEEIGDHGFAHQAGKVQNKSDFDYTLMQWADLLVKRLNEAHGKTSN